ncbi:MAG: DUF1993 domain-containing protein [candidate division SR1 bacterium]|nr:DUF1993 domain-containing protein [candidate division SR1 bacterium]
MSQNIYEFSVEMMVKSTNSIIVILQKADSLKTENGMSDVEILQARLAPDMLPFVKQIQIVSDNLKGHVSKLAGIEAPVMEDTETTLAQLIQRLKTTVEFAQNVNASTLEQADERKILMPRFSDKTIKPNNFLRDFGIPNFYFHLVTAYGILRNLGFEIGKGDYIGEVQFDD